MFVTQPPMYVSYALDTCATMYHVLFRSLSQVLYLLGPVSTLGFHPEAVPTSELHPGPPKHTQEELRGPFHICLSLELQDQTILF